MSNLYTVEKYLSQSDLSMEVRQILERRHSVTREVYDDIFSNQRFIDVLINDYKEYGNLIVAFDFDDTVKPSNSEKPSCNLVVDLLRVCSGLGFTMICYTARANQTDFEMIKNTCNDLGIKIDYINEDCDAIKKEWDMECVHKIFYNVFLDDRAGLKQSYEVLWGFIDWFLQQDINSIDSRKGGY